MLGGVAIMARRCQTWTPACSSRTAPATTSTAPPCTCSRREQDIAVEIKKLLVFIVGAVAIGLILLDHEHCKASADAAADPHAAHDHRRLFY